VFVTELIKSGKFRVVEREQLQALMQGKHISMSDDVDPKTAVKIGKLLGVNYLLTGAVTEYGSIDVSVKGLMARKFVAALNARLINASTGEVVWADEASQEQSTVRISVSVSGGGVDDNRILDKLMKSCIQKLTASLKAAAL
jgi:curli biogenesis system outer membrane secretion channel CsgG